MKEKLKGKAKKQENNVDSEPKASKFPDAFGLLLVLAVICVALTYIIPAGTFDMITTEIGAQAIDPSSFHYIDQTPVGLLGFLKSIPQGLVQSAEIVFFIFIIGGSFEIANATGALNAGMGKLVKTFNGREKILIPLIIIVLSMGANAFGVFEEVLPFITLMVTMSIGMGLDSITGLAMLVVGSGVGYAATFMNPFNLGVAQGIAGLPQLSGMKFRIIGFIGMNILTIAYIMIYARKIKKDPSLSLMYEIDRKRTDKLNLDDLPEFGTKEKSVILIIVATMVLLVFGVINYGWHIMEIGALFLGMSMAIAIVARMGLNDYSSTLVKGMAGIAGGALIVGFASAIIVILTEGNILHTILNSAAGLLKGRSSNVAAMGMYAIQSVLNFIIPSGSGKAAITMPLLIPIGDMVGITRQTIVLAFQYGDGISNILTPVSGTFMAALALAKIPWTKWAKWILPLVTMQYIFGAIMVLIANAINFGPF